MRLKNIPRARSVIAGSPYVVPQPEQYRGQWSSLFGSGHPLHLEIGTGKGRFLMEMAERHPDINYIGIEKYSSVLLRGVEEQDSLRLPNVRFIRGEAEMICTFFDVHEISRIYLNFSDPWPKKRNAKRRLPSRTFLARYNIILADDGQIEFKTDNRPLFDFAVAEVPGSPFRIRALTYDLHADPILGAGNIMTEYEEKFSALGNRICKYILVKTEDARNHMPTPQEIAAATPRRTPAADDM